MVESRQIHINATAHLPLLENDTMGRAYEEIDYKLHQWLEAQPVFFVASAPLASDGHVNVSPKGGSGTLRVLDQQRVAYLDMTGSGSETIAHLRENGRITLMFCAFEGPPRIVRLYGTGSHILPGELEWAAVRNAFSPSDEIARLVRAIITVDVDRVQDSCGYVVPLMNVVAERDTMYRWANEQERKNGPGWDVQYRNEKNALSIDGLPALTPKTVNIGTEAE
jgi:Pyridoxamine 5'-phosphate oxidase